MGLGILEDYRVSPVPGTSTIFAHRQGLRSSTVTPADTGLKYDTSQLEPILLVPQPSSCLDDPLNQPLWRRDLQLAVLSLLAVIATTLSPVLAADSLDLSFYFGTSFGKIALLTGWHLLAVGVAGIFFVPSARVWGKRHLYLLGTVVVCASCAWAGASGHNYTSLVWARVFQGIGLAPFEALVNASVGDLFFVHERGKRMALSNLALFGGAFFTPVIVGKINASLGWKWSFYFVTIFSGLFLPLLIFFVPETAYRRPSNRSNDSSNSNQTVGSDKEGSQEPSPHSKRDTEESAEPCAGESLGYEHQHPITQKPNYWRTLLPFNGRKTDDSYFKLLFRPLPLFLHPGILWACLIQGTLIGWTVFIGIVLAAILLGPPLWFSSAQVGYMYTAAFIGALCGFVVSGLIADSSAKWLTRRNRGVFEPEFRIVLVIPQLLFGGIGLYGFGWTSANTYKYGWVSPCVFFAFEVAGMVCGAVASALYIADAHADIAIEAFTCVLIFKNVFSFGLTYHGYDWLVKLGVRPMFNIVASVQVGICLTGILMCMWAMLVS
ncbi:MAG: hypothetical protein M1828_005482 [Chrysothrix sp. TS-e1954]|nr:MAG: hypothetical protein M1828_005482 [Chrysothrix sp. TS-e1954]